MKKYYLIALAVGIITVATINLLLNSTKWQDITLANALALSTEFTLSGEMTGAGITTQSACHSKCGYWNMALTVIDGGVVTSQCEIEGELSVCGVTIRGAYKRGQPYVVAWTLWACTQSAGNCCIAASQGVYVK
jgi:hypothetical protein